MDVKGGGQGEGQNGGDVADDATGAIFHRVVVGSCFVLTSTQDGAINPFEHDNEKSVE